MYFNIHYTCFLDICCFKRRYLFYTLYNRENALMPSEGEYILHSTETCCILLYLCKFSYSLYMNVVKWFLQIIISYWILYLNYITEWMTNLFYVNYDILFIFKSEIELKLLINARKTITRRYYNYVFLLGL